MTDQEIILLYWDRNELAIRETQRKYSSYCRKIAVNILLDIRDVDECESDTYLTVWNTIPPQRPSELAPYLGRITRNLSLKRLRQNTAQKRGGTTATLSLDELLDCIPECRSFDATLEARELGRCIDRFLRTLPQMHRRVFICRYFYCDSLEDICQRTGWGMSRLKMTLLRVRNKLKTYLEKEGVFIEE